jgi:hypothetical protein
MIGDMHGISDRSASRCIHGTASAICDQLEQFITWPNENKIQQSKIKFYEKTNGFPCILGAIDGTQIPLLAPHQPHNEAVYVNRKGYHSINCQVICDSDMKIYDFNAMWPGSCHDSYILHNSHVWDKFEENRIPDTWLLGDSGYALRKWLLVPYLNPADAAQIRYNNAHRRARSVVERCIGVLKTRWRCLTKNNMFAPEKASKIFAACAALQNLAITHGIQLDDIVENNNEEEIYQLNQADDAPGARVRDELVARVFAN